MSTFEEDARTVVRNAKATIAQVKKEREGELAQLPNGDLAKKLKDAKYTCDCAEKNPESYKTLLKQRIVDLKGAAGYYETPEQGNGLEI